MSQAARPLRLIESETELPHLPREAMTPDQHREAVRLAEAAAEQRISLGVKLLSAAEAETTQQHRRVDEIRQEQRRWQEGMQRDVASSFKSYDQWVGRFDTRIREDLENLGQRVEHLRSQWHATEQRIEQMVKRSEAMLDRCRDLEDAPATTGVPVPTAGNRRGDSAAM